MSCCRCEALEARAAELETRLQTLIDAATTRDLSGHPELKAALKRLETAPPERDS